MNARLRALLPGDLVERVRSRLEGLEPRERMMLATAAAITLALVAWLGVWDPLTARLERLDRRIAAARRDRTEIARLLAKHARLSRELAELERRAGSEGGTSLFAQLELMTVPLVGRERIQAMNPSTHPVGERFQEESVDLRLSGVTMADLVRLLYDVEDGRPPMSVSRLGFKRQYKDPALLDVTLVVSRLRPR